MARAPQRRCAGCGERRAKSELVRLVAEEMRVVVDREARRPGRGAYVCDADCLRRAIARGGLARALRRPVGVTEETLESLRT